MPSPLQVTQNSAAGSATISVAFPSPVAKGNLLIAIVSNDATAQHPSVVSDTQGNTWTLGPQIGAIDSFAAIAMYFAIAKTSGPDIVQWGTGGSASADLMIQILEYPWSSAVLDVSGSDAASLSVTTTQTVDLVIAAVMDGAAAPPGGWAAINAFTIRENVNIANSGTAVADKTTAAAGLVSTTFSDNQSGSFLGVIAAFKGAAVANPTKLEISLFGTKRYQHSAPAKCSESPPEKPVTLFEEE